MSSKKTLEYFCLSIMSSKETLIYKTFLRSSDEIKLHLLKKDIWFKVRSVA